MNIGKKTKIEWIADSLDAHRPQTLNPNNRGHASVAMLLKEGTSSSEVLFIVRADHDRDPWSGNIGFPGGRLNHDEESPRRAAERETSEELNLDLGQAAYLGQLDDLYGAILPVLVSCFVYRIPETARLQPNHEVASTFWCPLTTLLEPTRHKLETFTYRGSAREHPVVRLLEPGRPFLWGITYRLIRNFFTVCDIDFGFAEPALVSNRSLPQS